jgi:hypothetical protein
VQTAGNLIGLVVEFTARVQRSKHNLKRALAGLFVHTDRNTDAVILDRTATIGMNPYDNMIAPARQCLVDGIIKNFVYKVVQPAGLSVADVHIGPLANGL